MNDFPTLVRSGHFQDNTGLIPYILKNNWRYVTLTNAQGTGASTMHSMLEYFLDIAYDCREVFRNLELGREENEQWMKHMRNRFVVIRLDFSDFHGRTYEEAMDFFRAEMGREYRRQILLRRPGLKEYWLYDEWYLKIVEETADEKLLSTSLQALRRVLSTCKIPAENGIWEQREHVAVLIDNLVRMEVAAEEYGYEWEMEELLRKFRIEDEYKYMGLFFQTGDVPSSEEESMWCGSEAREAYRYGLHNFDLKTDPEFCRFAVPPECQYAVPEVSGTPNAEETVDWTKYVRDMRRKREEDELAAQKEFRKREKERQMRQQIPLDPETPRISPNQWVRSFQADPGTAAYRQLNDVVLALYDTGKREKMDLYYALQGIDQKQRTDMQKRGVWYIEHFFQQAAGDRWRIVPNSDSNWVQFMVLRNGEDMKSWNYLLFYIRPDSLKFRDLFRDGMLYLMDHMEHGFCMKASRFERKNPICLWTAVSDLPVVDRWLAGIQDRLQPGSDFLGLRNGVGLTRETRWSYNETMAELLAVYFRMVKSREEVSLTGLMDLLIRRWITREPVSDLPLSDLDAKLYLVILDSLSMRLEGIPAEETILLLDDEDLLSKLSDCESWADVNDAMARLRKERTP